jgi:periodic tryptophan protein 2
VRLWDVFEGRGNVQTFTAASDVLAVQFRPDGRQISAATLAGDIMLCDVVEGCVTAEERGDWPVLSGGGGGAASRRALSRRGATSPAAAAAPTSARCPTPWPARPSARARLRRS